MMKNTSSIILLLLSITRDFDLFVSLSLRTLNLFLDLIKLFTVSFSGIGGHYGINVIY